jgi:beta-phosphoglucomutase-like phosphatase (HAD superfamily)
MDELAELLKRRQQGEDKERKRKRDRLMEWMTSSSSTNKKSSSPTSMVRPINMKDGSVMQNSQEEAEDPPRKQPRFDKLFAGMPSLDEILLPKGSSTTTTTTPQNTPLESTNVQPEEEASSPPKRPKRDDSWFEEEKRQIEANYLTILNDMKSQLAQQRQQDPRSVPDSAEGVAESVIKAELKRTLASVKITRAKERLQDYQVDKMSDLNARDLKGATDEVVQRILKDTAKDSERKETLQAEVDDFMKYQKDALQGAKQQQQQAPTGREEPLPQPGSDLDAWALDRLQDMMSTTRLRNNDEGGISDILEQNIEDLRERMEKESKKGTIQPQTMKEWQMYRAIATRLAKLSGAAAGETGAILDFDDEQIAGQLESWKQYITKEEDIRNRSGLSVGQRMPFEWHQAGKDPLQTLEATTLKNPSDKRTRREVRREVNMKAIQAMEELVKRTDSVRAESLKQGLAALKAELEPRDYNDIEEELVEEELKTEPIDMSGVFKKRDTSEDNEKDKRRTESLSSTSYSTMGDLYNKEEDAEVSSTSTPFFSDAKESIQEPSFLEMSKDSDETFEPPKTPFFDDAEDDEEESPYSPSVSSASQLGTGDEQKLRAMYQRAGATTSEEKVAIKDQWEAFQKFEQEKRNKFGLSGGDDSFSMDSANVKYDMADVMKEDGDFDADKILSTIGPRPVRKKGGIPLSSTPEKTSTASDSPAKVDPLKSKLDPAEVSESLYRSVSAVGGGRTKDDPEAKKKEKAQFEEYLQKENELRQNLDTLDESTAVRAASINGNIDDASYAEEVLSSIGPRPIFKRKKMQVIDEGEYSDRGGALASEESDDDSSEDQDDDDAPPQLGLVPEWLQKERKESKEQGGYDSGSDISRSFLGSDIDEVFDDDKYDHNMRQLAEYERRRRGEKRQMGIDISDVLGRNAPGSDDYADYTYHDNYLRAKNGDWGAANFEARKANLLEYTEMSIVELNNLMDHKGSVHSTGVSQYMPRINKPFKEFGAIFRLEGVLVDTMGLQQQAWTMVADEFGFKEPVREEIQRATVTRPDIAVRQIFYWTDDVILCRDAAIAHQRIVKELLDKWAQEQGLTPSPPTPPTKHDSGGSMALGEDILTQNGTMPPVFPRNEEQQIQIMTEAWTETAQQFGFAPPSIEQVVQSSILSPDIAVRSGFRWAFDSRQIDAIASTYTRILQELTGESPAPPTSSVNPSTTQEAASILLDESAMLELQYMVWTKIAQENGLESPSTDEVVAASVLNDPEAVMRIRFRWDVDASRMRNLAFRYRDLLAVLVNEKMHGRAYEAPAPSDDTVKSEVNIANQKSPVTEGPTPEEILKTQIEAWKETAAAHNFQPPSSDQTQLTMNMNANEAVRRLLAWTYNFNDGQIKAISATYEEALKTASQKYMRKYGLTAESAPVKKSSVQKESTGPSGDQMFQAAFDAWTHVAWKLNYALPTNEKVMFALSVGPEEAILKSFKWTKDAKEAKQIADQYKEQISIKLKEWERNGVTTKVPAGSARQWASDKTPLVKIMPGVSNWVKNLRDVEMKCGVTSYFDRDQVDVLLKYAGLTELFPQDKRVSSSNGYGRESMQMLGAALRIERRPDHCVVFDTSPYATAAAHEMEMRSVSIVGPYPRYELLSADTAAISFDEFTAMNIRRLFGERVYDQPMLDTQQNQPETRRKTKTKFWDDD